MNRAARRRARRAEHVGGIVLPLWLALDLDAEYPAEGLREVLYGIRADHGPDVTVGICAECQTVEVVA